MNPKQANLNKRQNKKFLNLVNGTARLEQDQNAFIATAINLDAHQKKEILRLAAAANGQPLWIFFKLIFIPFIATLTASEIIMFFDILKEWEGLVTAGVGSISMLWVALHEKLNQNKKWLQLYDKYKIYAH